MSAISLRDLTVRVGGHDLVHHVSLDVTPGSWCTVIGPNGAGKTTLVEAVAGLRTLASGQVTLDGAVLSGMSARERARRVSLVPQHPVIPAGMSVHDYVALGRTAYHGVLRAPSSGDRAVVESVLERVELTSFRHRDVATLSGGERQRMVMGRALAQSTMVMVLDEPTTGLDLRHQMTMLEMLRREVDDCGLTVLATLHDLTLAGQFADRLVLLNQGEVVLEGPASDVVRSEELAKCYEMELRVVEINGNDVVVPVRDTRDGLASGSTD
ncbi:MAG: ABC transporter ATP-binding protein [Acidobacteriota bacterium]|nr:ABC transporter ATP-binding protein [Acidobacteriota bacterium]